ERLTLIRIFEDLRDLGYAGGYDTVRRYARSWTKERGAVTAEAYVPLYYAPGEAYQFDWSHEIVVLDSLPRAQWLLGDRGYDADWFRDALQAKGITPCIPGRKSRTEPVRYDKRRYKRRNRIEIMFGRLKDWRRVATRYDRCPTVFLSTIALAATVLFWL
ncbi:transposase, partial [Brucella sp. TWI559]